jgi:hypothetical protein
MVSTRSDRKGFRHAKDEEQGRPLMTTSYYIYVKSSDDRKLRQFVIACDEHIEKAGQPNASFMNVAFVAEKNRRFFQITGINQAGQTATGKTVNSLNLDRCCDFCAGAYKIKIDDVTENAVVPIAAAFANAFKAYLDKDDVDAADQMVTVMQETLQSLKTIVNMKILAIQKTKAEAESTL